MGSEMCIRDRCSLTPTQPGSVTTRLRATLCCLGEPLRWSAGRSGVSPSHRWRSTGALPSAAAQEHVPAKGCHPACVQAVPRDISWSPVPSVCARSELGLSPLSLASIVTLSDSHVFPGEIVAMSGLGSAPAVAMMVAGCDGDPTLAALCAIQTGCAHRGGRLLIRIRAAFPVVVRGSCAEAGRHRMHRGCLHAMTPSFKCSHGRRERGSVPELAPQWDGRETS